MFFGALDGSAVIRRRSISFPRDNRDITVPIGTSRISAISL
jgi:hypothetical protein